MGRCQLCGKRSPLISSRLGTCLQCIQEQPDSALEITDRVHEEVREEFGLPPRPPHSPNGLKCAMCANDCRVGIGEKGFCGLVYNVEGSLTRMGGTPEKGVLEWYYDPLPTNCVAWWLCPGCTGAGYPRYAHQPRAEIGHSNLAVFYGACSSDCLFCQNWHYRSLSSQLQPSTTAESLAEKADKRVSCICFFGGDPSVQMPHALKTSELALNRARANRQMLRICWETNGYWKDEFASKAAELSLESGGIIKFDLKTWDDNLNRALCGVSNAPTLHSFRMIGQKFFKQRPDLPFLTASTLLVPGYVDSEEIGNIARFISEIDPNIPFTLLAFCPQYVMSDLPATSRDHAESCLGTAEKYLKNVRIGNINLLW